MSPLIGEPISSPSLRLVTLGPITLPTLKGEISETLGDQLETVGAGVVAGERRPRPLPLTIPIHGDALDANRYTAGLRLRRQVRSLMENSRARLEGLYLAWSVDPEQNGWLLIGGADLKDGAGGVTMADFELVLTDCYRVATLRTHRPARRIVRLDRRDATTPRDYLGTLFSTNFAAVTPAARHPLGVGISDAISGATRAPATTATISTAEGDLAYATDQVAGDVIDFNQAEGDMARAIVRVHDTRGSATETDWEAVYGPDFPLIGAPVLNNAICRVVPDMANGRFDVQGWTGSAWVTDATIAHVVGGMFRLRIVEYTSDRAVICATSIPSAGVRGETYITLQRGWTGPRVELYATNTAGTATATVNVYAKTTGDATYQRSTGSATAIVNATSIGTFTGLEPWVALVGPGTDRGVALAVLQEAVNLRGALLSSREGLAFESPTGYVSVTVGLGARATAATDADALGAMNLTDTRSVPEVVSRG